MYFDKRLSSILPLQLLETESIRAIGKRIKISKKDVMNETKGSIET